jgi:hypothetical protein
LGLGQQRPADCWVAAANRWSSGGSRRRGSRGGGCRADPSRSLSRRQQAGTPLSSALSSAGLGLQGLCLGKKRTRERCGLCWAVTRVLAWAVLVAAPPLSGLQIDTSYSLHIGIIRQFWAVTRSSKHNFDLFFL